MNRINSYAPAAVLLADFSHRNEHLQRALQYVQHEVSRTVRGPAMQ